MTITTTKPKRDIYVRITPRSLTSPAAKFSGRVAKVLSEGPRNTGETIVVVNVAGEPEPKVFNGNELDLITKKEYFKEALRSG